MFKIPIEPLLTPGSLIEILPSDKNSSMYNGKASSKLLDEMELSECDGKLVCRLQNVKLELKDQRFTITEF